MVLQVNQELCVGCGACVDACSAGAIRLVDQRALIVEALCTKCEACADVCPNAAITTVSIPVRSAAIIASPAVEPDTIPYYPPVASPDIVTPTQRLVSLTGTALADLGREVAPRLTDVLIDAVERRLTRPTTTAIAPHIPSARCFTERGRGKRKRARSRRGHTGKSIYNERR